MWRACGQAADTASTGLPGTQHAAAGCGVATLMLGVRQSLSGQRQRLFIALAFVNSPEVVFLDELTQGLDPQARHATWELIGEIRQGGTTVVLVTHFMDEAEHLCDRVAVVDRGRVMALDTTQRLIDGLGLPSVVRFTTSEPDLGWLEKLEVVESLARRGEAVEIRGSGAVLALVASELVAHAPRPTAVLAVLGYRPVSYWLAPLPRAVAAFACG